MYEAPFGSLGPFGKHKGYGLALMCELLGGALAGEWTAQPARERAGTIVNHMLMVVIDPAAFGNRAAFQQEVFAMVDYIHSTTPARGFDRVRVPGDPEREATRRARTRRHRRSIETRGTASSRRPVAPGCRRRRTIARVNAA